MKFRRYDCAAVREMLPLHVGGDLEERHTASVDAHLHACLNCFREYRELANARGRLAAVADEPLPDGILDGFADEVMARIRASEPLPAAGPRRAAVVGLPVRRLLAAAAVIVAAGLAVTLVIDRPGAPVDDALSGGAVSPAGFADAARPESGRADFDPTRGWPAPGVRDRSSSGATPAADHGGGARRAQDARAFGLDPRMLERMLAGASVLDAGDPLGSIPPVDPTALGSRERLHVLVMPTSRLLEIKQALELMAERGASGADAPASEETVVSEDAPGSVGAGVDTPAAVDDR